MSPPLSNMNRSCQTFTARIVPGHGLHPDRTAIPFFPEERCRCRIPISKPSASI